MKSLRNLGIAIGFLALGACSSYSGGNTSGGAADTGVSKAKLDCSTVRCASCPEGQTPALKPPDCCRCVPIK